MEYNWYANRIKTEYSSVDQEVSENAGEHFRHLSYLRVHIWVSCARLLDHSVYQWVIIQKYALNFLSYTCNRDVDTILIYIFIFSLIQSIE